MIHALALAFVLIVLDLAVVVMTLMAGFHPGPPVVVFNAVTLVAVFFLVARGRIRFRG